MLFLLNVYKLKLFVRTIVIAAISCIGIAQLEAMQTSEVQDSDTDLWVTDPLPKGVIAKYGSSDRNSEAVGVHGLRYSNNGELLAIKGDRRLMRILNLKERKLVAVLPYEKFFDFVFTPDDQSMAIGNSKSIRIWDIQKREEVKEINQAGYKIAFNHAGDKFTSLGIGEAFRSQWPQTATPQRFKTTLTTGTILPAGLSSDGRLVVFHNRRRSELLDMSTGSPVAGGNIITYQQSAFSKDSTQMVAFNKNLQSIVYYDFRNLAEYQVRLTDKNRLTSAAFSNDGRFLYTGNYKNEIVLWDLLTKQEIGRFVGHKARVHTIAAEPNGMLRFASGSAGIPDRSVVLWDLQSIVFPDGEIINDVNWGSLWRDLGSQELLKSLNATRKLSQILRQDENAYATLESKLNLVKVDRDVDELLKQLDSPEFSVRENATKQLGFMSRDIRPKLERHLKTGSQEAKWRIKKMLQSKSGKPSSNSKDGRRNARIVLALELCGDKNAAEFLKKITEVSSYENMIFDAEATIKRLGNAAQSD